MQPINSTQIKLLHVGIAALKIQDAVYRDLLWTQFGVKTCKDLTYEQASGLIDDLKRKGFRIKQSKPRGSRGRKKRPQSDNLIYLPSRQELALIDRLRIDVRWRNSDGYDRWIQKFLGGHSRLRTSKEAQKVIEALKAMKKRQERPSSEVILKAL